MAKTQQLFEPLVESGMRPELARRLERKVHSAIDIGIGQHRQNDHALLMTKADGMAIELSLRSEMAQLETRLMRYIHDHGWKMMGVQVAVMGLMLTAFKYLH